VLEPLQMMIDCGDGLPALQGRRRGFPAHALVPDELALLEVLWPLLVDPSPAVAVVAPESLVEDVPVSVVEVPVVVPVLPVDVLPLAPDESPVVVVEPVPSVVGVGLPEDPSPPALVGVEPVSSVVGLAVGGGPVLIHPGGAVGVGLFAARVEASPTPVVAAEFPAPPPELLPVDPAPGAAS
jgi:hypothetical protein